MKVAAYQMPVHVCYGAHALEHLRTRVQECERAGVDLLCCSEGALGGLADYVDKPEAIALSADLHSLAHHLRPLASHTVMVVVGFTERDDAGHLYNAAAVYADSAVVGVYRKRHPAIRRSRYTADTTTPVFTVNGTTLGVLICRDSTNAQLAKTLVERGAQLLCIPTNNAMPPDRAGPELVDEVRALDARLATQLGVSIIRADVVGAARGLACAGASMITAPSGISVSASGNGEGDGEGELVIAEVTLNA